jgi:Na+-transporting NADH:ubiquinone oxidoreductase subunit C
MKLDVGKPLYVVGFMVVTAAVFTGAIMALDVSTRDLAERNSRLKVQRWLVETFDLYAAQPGAKSFADLSDDQVIGVFNRRVERVLVLAEPDRNGVPLMPLYVIYAADRAFPPSADLPREVKPEAFKDDPELLGVAFPLEGIGFWELIQGWMAVDRSFETVRGVLFVRHAETPGLGGKISTDRRWLAQWRGKSIAPPAGDEPYFHVTNDANVPADRRIDALSAATQTGNRIEAFGNENVRRFRRAMGFSDRRVGS